MSGTRNVSILAPSRPGVVAVKASDTKFMSAGMKYTGRAVASPADPFAVTDKSGALEIKALGFEPSNLSRVSTSAGPRIDFAGVWTGETGNHDFAPGVLERLDAWIAPMGAAPAQNVVSTGPVAPGVAPTGGGGAVAPGVAPSAAETFVGPPVSAGGKPAGVGIGTVVAIGLGAVGLMVVLGRK